MSLFQNRPQAGDTIQYYTLGQNRTILIVGLGNPGPEHEDSRHNIGFVGVEAFVKTSGLGEWMTKKDLKCELASGQLGDNRVIVIKPATFMNLSGEAVQAVVNFYKIAPDKIVVVHDELDIPFGQIRLRTGGGDAGHNGVKSVIDHLGGGFGRVRIGVGPKEPEQMDSADFVLAKFSPQQHRHLKELRRETSAILSEYVYGDGQLPQDTRNFLA